MTEKIRKELAKIHANHQLSKITNIIADELDERKAVEEELKSRIAELEEKKMSIPKQCRGIPEE